MSIQDFIDFMNKFRTILRKMRTATKVVGATVAVTKKENRKIFEKNFKNG